MIARFDEWIDRKRMVRQDAVQLGMWVVMGLDPAEQQSRLDEMNARQPEPTAGPEAEATYPAPEELDAAAEEAKRAQRTPRRRRAGSA